MHRKKSRIQEQMAQMALSVNKILLKRLRNRYQGRGRRI